MTGRKSTYDFSVLWPIDFAVIGAQLQMRSGEFKFLEINLSIDDVS